VWRPSCDVNLDLTVGECPHTEQSHQVTAGKSDGAAVRGLRPCAVIAGREVATRQPV